MLHGACLTWPFIENYFRSPDFSCKETFEKKRAWESLIENKHGSMVGINNGKIVFTPLDKALKGKEKINKELLRMSKIMNT